jgi:hypothetical protein
MTDWTGPDTYAAVVEAVFVVAVIAAEFFNIRWHAHFVRISPQPTHTPANTLAWLGLLLSVLLLVGSFIMAVKSSPGNGSTGRVRAAEVFVGLAYVSTMAAAFSIGRTVARSRRRSGTGKKPTRHLGA